MPSTDVNSTDPAHIEAVRRRLVAAPANAKRAGPMVLVRQYRHVAGQTPGWRLLQQRQLQPAGRADVVRLTLMTLAADDNADSMLKLDVYETVSPEAANALMVELLTGFQTLPERLVVSREIGDAEVMLPDDRTRLFTRGNLVVSVTNAGTRIVAAGETAKALDDFITAPARPAAMHKRGAAPSEAAAPEGAMLRFVTDGGALRQDAEGTLLVEADRPPAVAYALDEQSGAWYPVALGKSGPSGRRKR